MVLDTIEKNTPEEVHKMHESYLIIVIHHFEM